MLNTTLNIKGYIKENELAVKNSKLKDLKLFVSGNVIEIGNKKYNIIKR